MSIARLSVLHNLEYALFNAYIEGKLAAEMLRVVGLPPLGLSATLE
jgi:hypothetical protein